MVQALNVDGLAWIRHILDPADLREGPGRNKHLEVARSGHRESGLKILQITSGLEVNGALEHCRLLSRQLARHGHSVTIALRRGSWLWKHVDQLPVQMIECDMNRWPLTDLARMADWVKSHGFDVMHTHMSRAHLYGILLRQMSGVPVVATSHAQYYQPHWYFNDHVIANSESTLRHQRRYNLVPRSRSTRIHCFVDLERLSAVDAHWRTGMRNQWHVDGAQKVIGIVGDVVPYKGHIFLFRALPELVRRFPGLRVIVVGRFHRKEACTRKLRRFQLENGLERHVRWIGRRDNMHMVLSGVDVVAVPSLVESMGMVAVEAMSAGRPVVAARTGGLTDLVFHEENGLLVPPADPHSLADALTRLLSDDKLSKELADNGREWVRANLDPETLTRQIEDIYRRVGKTGETGEQDPCQAGRIAA